MAEGSPQFHTTRWSLVAQASGAPGEAEQSALDELLRAYWYPLYAFARRSGMSSADAQDHVQGFVAALLEKDYVGDADPDRGRFRTFLIAAFRNYCSKERDKAQALKRGGGQTTLSLDFDDGERRYSAEPADALTPEDAFERRWAHLVLDRAAERLAASYRSKSPKHAERFDALYPLLTGGLTKPYREIGEQLDLSETAVKVAAHRLRTRYREALRGVIADTLTDASQVDDEIHRLMAALAAR